MCLKYYGSILRRDIFSFFYDFYERDCHVLLSWAPMVIILLSEK